MHRRKPARPAVSAMIYCAQDAPQVRQEYFSVRIAGASSPRWQSGTAGPDGGFRPAAGQPGAGRRSAGRRQRLRRSGKLQRRSGRPEPYLPLKSQRIGGRHRFPADAAHMGNNALQGRGLLNPQKVQPGPEQRGDVEAIVRHDLNARADAVDEYLQPLLGGRRRSVPFCRRAPEPASATFHSG